MNKWITTVFALFSVMTFSACSATNEEVAPVVPTPQVNIKKFVGGRHLDVTLL